MDVVPVPKAQMIAKQDWRYVSGAAQLLLRGAHPPDTDITSLAFSQDNLKLLSRAADDTLKVSLLTTIEPCAETPPCKAACSHSTFWTAAVDHLKRAAPLRSCRRQVWDLRKFKAPLHVFAGLPNLMSTTGVCFGPNNLAVTGTSAMRDGSGGSVVFVDLAKEAIVRRIGMPSNVVALHWSQKLNQIFVGVGRAPQLGSLRLSASRKDSDQ